MLPKSYCWKTKTSTHTASIPINLDDYLGTLAVGAGDGHGDSDGRDAATEDGTDVGVPTISPP